MMTKVESIVQSLQEKEIIHLDEQVFTRMKGTTDGQVLVLKENGKAKYILKLDQPQQIDYVEKFLRKYQHVGLFPKLLYSDSNKNFILYSYIEGTTHFNRGSKVNWMSKLVEELFNHYEKCDKTLEWGRIGIPRQSWHEFNTYSVEGAYSNLGSLLPIEDYNKVKFLVDKLFKLEKEEKYMLHGDTGVHNFVFHNYELAGIIDPSPLVGPVLYDFTYAFCSSPDDLNLETLFTAFSLLKNVNIDKTRLIEEVLIQLYTRIGICAKVHPHELDEYLEAWEYWRDFLPC